MTNILVSIKNIIETSAHQIEQLSFGQNRINNVGTGLELFIKDSYSGALGIDDDSVKHEKYSSVFSYLGNQNNPPDIMISGGDAIEVKKIESFSSSIALNSSYPKKKLFSNSSFITNACRKAEDWNVKDIIYTIGTIQEKKLRQLWMVYGDNYAASGETYEKIVEKVSKGIYAVPDIEFSTTKELAKIKNIDPLGITDLRVRGMWDIMHPQKVFKYLLPEDDRDYQLKIYALIGENKYMSFPELDRINIENKVSSNLLFKKVKVKNPDNLAILDDARLLVFRV
jgi:hypothetical protein